MSHASLASEIRHVEVERIKDMHRVEKLSLTDLLKLREQEREEAGKTKRSTNVEDADVLAIGNRFKKAHDAVRDDDEENHISEEEMPTTKAMHIYNHQFHSMGALHVEKQAFLPRIQPSKSKKVVLMPYGLGDTQNFSTRLQGRAYADMRQANKKEMERKLKAAGIETRSSKTKREVVKIGYDIHDAKGEWNYLLASTVEDKYTSFAFTVERQQSLDEKREQKMKHTLWRMHAQMCKAGYEQWKTWVQWHRKEYGKDTILSKIDEVNRIIKRSNIRHPPRRHVRGIQAGDMVLFRCLECDVDGDLRPTHVLECSPDDRKASALKIVGRVTTVADSQMRRGGKSPAMFTIVYRVRNPKHPMTEEEQEVNNRFVRQCICFRPFLIETTPILSTLNLEFPNFISRKSSGINEEDDDNDSIDSGDEEWVPTHNLWIERTILVPLDLIEECEPYRMKRLTRAIEHLHWGRCQLGLALWKLQDEKEAHSRHRVHCSIVLQCFWRSYLARRVALVLFRQRVALDRKEQRARRRIAKKAREEVRRRQAQRLRRANGLTLDTKWFHLTKNELNKFWHDRERGAKIIKKYVNKLRENFLRSAFGKWDKVSAAIIAQLKKASKPKSGIEMFREYEAQHAEEFVQEYDPDAVPWHSALGIRMPLMLTRDSIGAYTDNKGVMHITNLDRWRNFKERMQGPTDNSHWLLQGDLREDGSAMNARVLIGGFPRGEARPKVGGVKKHGSCIQQLLMNGVDTFVCLSKWDKANEDEILKVHADLRQELRVSVEGAKVRYKRAALGAEKAKDYAIAQKSVMVSRKIEAAASLRNCEYAMNKLTKFVRFMCHEIDEKKGIPTTEAEERDFITLLNTIERRIRSGQRLYIFSEHGHGRAGLVAACLLGRLYGITSPEALELVQRHHDARIDQTLPSEQVLGFPTAKWRGKKRSDRIAEEYSRGPRRSYVSCPRLPQQRQMVRRVLNPIQTNFNPTQLRDDSGPLEFYMMSRKEIFMSTQTHKKNTLKESREQKNKEMLK